MKNKDITPRNENNQPHGYWESYFSDGQLNYKGNYVNGKPHGYWDSYWDNGELDYKGFYDMGKEVSYNPNEPKAIELTLDEIALKLNIPVEQLKIKK
jgi:antitoxin component YwqK of YwqJK toxin-antitoxin module